MQPRQMHASDAVRFAQKPVDKPRDNEPQAAAAVAGRPQTVPSSRSPLIRLDATWPDEPIIRFTETSGARMPHARLSIKLLKRITAGQRTLASRYVTP
jgi:hypothetical protein